MSDIFAKEVLEGLTQNPKKLPSKYFYDDEGSRIFQEIMAMPEYYLTDCEFEIFKQQPDKIVDQLKFEGHFNLIELGAGDGKKTAQLIKYLVAQKVSFTYKPIDISQEANDILTKRLTQQFPDLNIESETGDYFEILAHLQQDKTPSLLLFIGSNIGNYTPQATKNLFDLFYNAMKSGDKLLVGADLKKNPLIIRQAYYDPHGITKRFNLNLLQRINRELNADFDLSKFDFYVSYDPVSGEVRSYLVSLANQTVALKKLNAKIEFKNGEWIWTELSKKYDLEELNTVISKSGFELITHITDQKHYFTDSLFSK